MVIFPKRDANKRNVKNDHLDFAFSFIFMISSRGSTTFNLHVTTDLGINEAAGKGGGLFFQHLYAEMMFQPTVKHGGEASVGGVWLYDN